MALIFQWREHFLDFVIRKFFKSLTDMHIVPFMIESIHLTHQVRLAERYQLILNTWINSSNYAEKGILSFKILINYYMSLISKLMGGCKDNMSATSLNRAYLAPVLRSSAQIPRYARNFRYAQPLSAMLCPKLRNINHQGWF